MLMPSLSVNGFANLSFFNYTDTHTDGDMLYVADCGRVCKVFRQVEAERN